MPRRHDSAPELLRGAGLALWLGPPEAARSESGHRLLAAGRPATGCASPEAVRAALEGKHGRGRLGRDSETFAAAAGKAPTAPGREAELLRPGETAVVVTSGGLISRIVTALPCDGTGR
jgi:hypothetical protein